MGDKVSIQQIVDEAGKGEKSKKEVLEKAKELGLKVKNAQSTISQEEADTLYNYITSGVLPDGFVQRNTRTQDKTKKAISKDSATKMSAKKTKEQKEVKSAEKTKTETKDKKVTIISRGKEDVANKAIEPFKEKKNAITTPTEIALETQEKILAPVTQEADILENTQPNIEVTMKQEGNDSKSVLPKGIDPNQIQKTNNKNRISAIRVISRNDEIAKPTRDSIVTQKKSAQMLDELKHIERKEKNRKKKEKPKEKHHKHNSQVIVMERDVWGGGYDDEQDEILLIDAYEAPQENYEEERAKKNELNDKIKVNRYSPWMKEGSIGRPSKGKGKKNRDQKIKRNNEAVTSLVLPEEIRVYEFAEKANLELGGVLGKLFLLGVKMLKNDFLDKDTIEILANEYNIEVTIQQDAPLTQEEEIAESDLVERPPVVTIMGHVDHGKTSLLDYIRSSRIASSEAGGITQHIGAYMVQKNGKWISFIDTPGHEAFAQMRSRGAQVTDIAIIVIAADDGVKQQSIEALNHAKTAGVQIIIAMNKMDKEGANPDKLKAECAELGFTPMDWGGEYEFIPISAKTGDGVDVLLETILLQAEILELKASQKIKAKAIVLEGSQQIGKGSVATIIVQQGILEIGQCIVADTAYGKVRTLKDDTGKNITRLEPSGVAQITGLSEVPLAGALLQVVENDSIAREIANKRSAYLRQKQLSKSTKVTFDELSSMVAKGQIKSLPVILRADTQGSLEAIKSSLENLNNQEVEINIIGFGVGGITQSDVDLANASSNCVILGFNVRPTSEIKNLAKDLAITIKSYSIIYDLIDDMKALLGGLMSPILEEEVVGIAGVRETFIVAKLGTIAGCMVVEGKIEKNLSVRILRSGVVLWNGKIASLKRFKDDVKEVVKGYECGIMLDGFNDIQAQDEIEVFREIEKQRVL
ncbi:translation initiation factor IF-2 [Helicobacter didelphidarum]|uniref:Translation initiation factor IF-2 n=1 Tax=Helicobacter didelphidarum TaxID=2040648 RepID=A0A3D8IJK7_9HELI|nr:translation initiation factor IF-2 [Helicobacter didelphidarum]RDU65313.1 translation initiation factor IF-2 [Helicobacter didelphidarum]